MCVADCGPSLSAFLVTENYDYSSVFTVFETSFYKAFEASAVVVIITVISSVLDKYDVGVIIENVVLKTGISVV